MHATLAVRACVARIRDGEVGAMSAAPRRRRLVAALAVAAVAAVVTACGDDPGTGAASDATTRVVPTVLPPDVSVATINEEHPLPEDLPDGSIVPDRLVWFGLEPSGSVALGLMILDLHAATDDPSSLFLREAVRAKVGGRSVVMGTTTGEGESGAPSDLWFVRITARTWVLVGRPVEQRTALGDDAIAAVIAGLRPVDDAAWDAFVRAVAASTTTTTMDPIIASSGASGPGAPSSGPSGIDCMRTATPLPAALRLWPQQVPYGARVQVVGLGPACGDTTTIAIAPVAGSSGPARTIQFRISGSGSAAPTGGLPPTATTETVVAGARTVVLHLFLLGGSTTGASGTFEEAGRVVAFDASGYARDELLAMLAGLRPATATEWEQAGGRT